MKMPHKLTLNPITPNKKDFSKKKSPKYKMLNPQAEMTMNQTLTLTPKETISKSSHLNIQPPNKLFLIITIKTPKSPLHLPKIYKKIKTKTTSKTTLAKQYSKAKTLPRNMNKTTMKTQLSSINLTTKMLLNFKISKDIQKKTILLIKTFKHCEMTLSTKNLQLPNKENLTTFTETQKKTKTYLSLSANSLK